MKFNIQRGSDAWHLTKRPEGWQIETELLADLLELSYMHKHIEFENELVMITIYDHRRKAQDGINSNQGSATTVQRT